MSEHWLHCDLHIHTTLSDGKLPVCEVVDLYGSKGFDVISITDHILDDVTREERQEKNEPIKALRREEFPDYLRILWAEAKRAWDEYRMLVIPGTEITNNWKKYHILAIDIKEYIDPTLPVKKIVEEIHKQGAIAIACHPHHKAGEGKQPFIHLWKNWKKYVDIFDAWEVANRDDLFNVIGLKKFNYIANSDFHELWHIYSWKSLIGSEKNTEAIKAAIRENKEVAIYLFRKEKAREGISSL
ncbi:MAG: phosphotransferase [Euryarchaeota archaeon]|nr:phosphotransferase [Euryarchaeota archaeon]